MDFRFKLGNSSTKTREKLWRIVISNINNSPLFSDKPRNKIRIVGPMDPYKTLCFKNEDAGIISPEEFERRLKYRSYLKEIKNLELKIREDYDKARNNIEIAFDKGFIKDSLITNFIKAWGSYGALPICETIPKCIIFKIDSFKEKLDKLYGKEKEALYCFNNLAQPSDGITYFDDIHLALVRMAQDYTERKKLNFDYFIKNFGYMQLWDIPECNFENPIFILENIKKMVEKNPCIDYKSERYEVWFRRAMIRDRRLSTHKKLEIDAKKINHDSRVLINMSEYLGFSLEYNDRDRRRRTKGYQLIRSIAYNKGFDPKDFPIEQYVNF